MNHRLVSDPQSLARLCERVRHTPRVALDTEFHNEKSYAARLMVVQLAFDDEVVIVDPLAVADLNPLAQALAATTIVGHALSSDLRIFADRFERLPAAAFDTQLAAAFCGFGMSISLADLVDSIAGVRLRKSQTVSDWSTRPLAPKQIDYLVNDVAYLFTLADALEARLDALGRSSWFAEESGALVDLAQYRPDPDRLYLRIPGASKLNRRELGILRELARERDRLARERDVPTKYIVPDDVMSGLVQLRPDARAELAQLRRFDAGMRKAYGDQILAAIARGLALPDDDLPPRPPRGLPAARETIVTLMGVLVSTIAADNELPAALLAPRAKLERIARDLPKDRPELESMLGLGGWRVPLVVEPLWQLFSGRLMLGLEGFSEGAPRLAIQNARDECKSPGYGLCRQRLEVGARDYSICRLDSLERAGVAELRKLPYSLKILLENLLRYEDGRSVTRADIETLARWDPKRTGTAELAFRPARVLLQDFTGVPAVVDLAAMRDAIVALGGAPAAINPLQPVELVIDHSVQVDRFATADSFAQNVALEYERNRERYAFLKWGQGALDGFRVVPPGTGIVHQVNIEYLARVVFGAGGAGSAPPAGVSEAYPDTVVGTDSHTTMVNGLGVLAWGVGGIEAEAAMLGQPVTMLIPEVVGMRLVGKLREGVTSTDLVLTVTEQLRKRGVVGTFVEFFGNGLAELRVADRVTIGNMSPEYGSTVAIFPVDEQTLRYLRLTGRGAEHVALVEAYAKAQGLFRNDGDPDPVYTEILELDLSSVEPNIAGPRRPQDRVPLGGVKSAFATAMREWQTHRGSSPLAPISRLESEGGGGTAVAAHVALDEPSPSQREDAASLGDGSVVIAAITSCTNTSNPAVMIGAGLLAKKAVERGLVSKPWVKTSLAPGSKVVTDYLDRAGLRTYLDRLGFNLVGYGCTTCIGNSGPLPDDVADKVTEHDLIVAAVLSGNRNFEGRIHPQVRANYLASPPLVVAYAIAGRMDVDLTCEPLGAGSNGKPVFLRDIWPTNAEIEAVIGSAVDEQMFRTRYADVFTGDENWRAMPASGGERYTWDPASEYVKRPPYFDGMELEPRPPASIEKARVLALLGDSVTTDHISPAGNIAKSSPAARYLMDRGVPVEEFNSYGARRGNHEVMMRGTFANVRLRNELIPGVEGGVTVHFPTGMQMSIFDAAMKYRETQTPLVVLAGMEYGSGSSRDWAAKGPMLLGIRAVIAQSFERIHRSNLIGMGILPLEFPAGGSARALGLTGSETFTIKGLSDIKPRSTIAVRVAPAIGTPFEFEATVRIDTPDEADYYRHGGILQFVLRQLLR